MCFRFNEGRTTASKQIGNDITIWCKVLYNLFDDIRQKLGRITMVTMCPLLSGTDIFKCPLMVNLYIIEICVQHSFTNYRILP